MICASVVVAALLVSASPVEQPSAAWDTTYGVVSKSSVPQSGMAQSASLEQPGFDPLRFDSATVVALRALFDSAAAHRLPVKSLINKANQGAAYSVSGKRIVQSVREHFTALVDARAALGENATDSELDTGADALKKGADGKVLQEIRKTRTTRGSAVNALVVLTDLMERGIQTNKARDAILSLARISPTDEAINGLQNTVARNANRGPGMAQDALERYLRTNTSGAQKPASKPANRPPNPPDQS